MAFDYKKEYKEFYLPKSKPSIVTVPPMNYLAVRGSGDPNAEDGAYKQSIGLLYAVAFTIKMSCKGDHRIEGYFDYVVPPLEGFWRQEGMEAGAGIDYSRKADMRFISVIRLPEFVTKAEFDWAVAEAARKKGLDLSRMEFLPFDEGECVQCMHVGLYDGEPETIARMHAFAEENGYAIDLGEARPHHEIYLSDPRRCDPAKLKTVVRHPVRRK